MFSQPRCCVRRGTEHILATGGVECQQAYTMLCSSGDTACNGSRDVMQLKVKEYVFSCGPEDLH